MRDAVSTTITALDALDDEQRVRVLLAVAAYFGITDEVKQ